MESPGRAAVIGSDADVNHYSTVVYVQGKGRRKEQCNPY